MNENAFDVLQIGYGPVSQSLALMLGRQGRSVAVCERWEKRYPLPRAVCIDHELYRVLSANGLHAQLPSISHPGPLYQWFNAKWEELLVIDWSAPSISGGAEVNFVHQPTLEEGLDRAVDAQHSVTTMLGWEAIEFHQDDDFAHVTLKHMDSGETKVVSAKFVIGCDGANSRVRETIGGRQEDRGFEADWLVIDVLMKPGVTIEKLGIPAAGQYCNPERPTTIVPAGVREGRTYRRWEFFRLPGESAADLEKEERVWELLSPWAGPGDIELVRHKIYNFRSLLAQKWRDRRFLIAGDAAHVMPPFMGQGMCSGIRDAWNLAWRLGLILDGKAGDKLLDSYQPERFPHVSQIIDMSIYLGKIICMPDPEQAAARDREFLSGQAEPPPPFPQLTDGLLHRDETGALSAGAGLLSPHVHVRSSQFEGRLDELTGGGFVIIAKDADPRMMLTDAQRETLAALNVVYVGISAEQDANLVIDLDGRLMDFLAKHHWTSIIVRPDYYIYGGAKSNVEFSALIESFVSQMSENGVYFK